MPNSIKKWICEGALSKILTKGNDSKTVGVVISLIPKDKVAKLLKCAVAIQVDQVNKFSRNMSFRTNV